MSSLRPVSGTAAEVLALLREWDAAPDPDPLVIATSGSTGAPKRVVLSRAAMRASALATQERLGGPERWVLTLPPSYVAGVQVLYRSVVAGTEPVLMDGWEDDLPVPRERAYISLVPTQLRRRLDDSYDADVLRRHYQAVLVGGGPLAPEVRSLAEAAGITVVQTYGMSETCGGCVYDGVPLDGVEVRIREGEVQLRGPVLFDGYEGEPERTARVVTADGWFRTDDLGSLADDGRLRVTGRVDDVVLSGGLKIGAGAVARALAAYPEVREVEVLGVRDQEWGERVVAFVVGDVPERDAWPLDRRWWPRQVVVLDALPLLPNGKPDRVRLRELARGHG